MGTPLVDVRILTRYKVCQDADMSRTGPQVDLATSVGYRLKQASSALHGAMETVLRPLGLNITQYSCLELLSQRPGLTNAELARGTFVTRQSMNVLLQALEQDGAVTRPQVAPVGRALPAELTPLGRRRLAAASAAVRAVEDRMRSGLAATEVDRLGELLQRCIDGLQR
jgi:DNA-binding MarR family transcriptional regulator